MILKSIFYFPLHKIDFSSTFLTFNSKNTNQRNSAKILNMFCSHAVETEQYHQSLLKINPDFLRIPYSIDSELEGTTRPFGSKQYEITRVDNAWLAIDYNKNREMAFTYEYPAMNSYQHMLEAKLKATRQRNAWYLEHVESLAKGEVEANVPLVKKKALTVNLKKRDIELVDGQPHIKKRVKIDVVEGVATVTREKKDKKKEKKDKKKEKHGEKKEQSRHRKEEEGGERGEGGEGGEGEGGEGGEGEEGEEGGGSWDEGGEESWHEGEGGEGSWDEGGGEF